MSDAARPLGGADWLEAAYREWLVGRYGDRVITTNPQATFYGEMRHAFVAGAVWQAARPAPAAATEGEYLAMLERLDAWWLDIAGATSLPYPRWRSDIEALLALARAAAPVVGGGDAEPRMRWAIDRLERLHRRVGGAVDDFCAADDQAWPCDTALVMGAARPTPRADAGED